MTNRWLDLGLILLISYGLRLTIGYLFYNSLIFDEVFQIYEPAYFLAYGLGILPWEYYLGIRSWLIPGILAGIIKTLTNEQSLPQYILLCEQAFFVLLSLIPVATAYFWGLRLGGLVKVLPRHLAIALALMVGILSENVYLASHGSTEVIAAWLLFPAVYFASIGSLEVDKSRESGDSSKSWWRFPWRGSRLGSSPSSATNEEIRQIFYCGIFLGLSFIIRFHLAPSLVLLAVFAAQGLVLWRWRWLLIGAMIPVLGQAILDWVTLGTPLQSIWLNFWVNVIDRVSHDYGVQPPWEALSYPLRNWGWFVPFALYFAWRGGRRVPLAVWMVCGVVLTHSLISHKEARFIIPILPLLSFIVALGVIEFWVSPPLRVRFLSLNLNRPKGWVFLASFWVCLSVSLAFWSGLRYNWFRGSYMGEMLRYVSSMLPRPCGVALKNISFVATPGQSGLSPSILLYGYFDTAQLLREHAAFDVVIAGENEPELLAAGDYKHRCFATIPTRDHILNDFPITFPVCIWVKGENFGQCDRGAGTQLEIKWAAVPEERWKFGQKDLLRLRQQQQQQQQQRQQRQ